MLRRPVDLNYSLETSQLSVPVIVSMRSLFHKFNETKKLFKNDAVQKYMCKKPFLLRNVTKATSISCCIKSSLQTLEKSPFPYCFMEKPVKKTERNKYMFLNRYCNSRQSFNILKAT